MYLLVCGFPPEYCALGKKVPECKVWLEGAYPDMFVELYPPSAVEESKEETKEEEAPKVEVQSADGVLEAAVEGAAGIHQ